MIIECALCASKVDAKVLAEHEVHPDHPAFEPFKHVFAVCPVCNSALVGEADLIEIAPEEYSWTNLRRLWPNPPRDISNKVPLIVRSSIDEAEICFRSGAFSACAVMCGRALEGICIESTGEKTIAAGLRKLKEKNIIDSRLFDWAESLRKERNIGAHASGEAVKKADARDILEFARAIIEYIYILSARYEEYKKRKESKG